MKTYKRRRREFKTDYRKRLILLKGNCLRLVIRKTNRYIILQIVDSEAAKDKVLFSVNSKELLKLGWPVNKKNSLKSVCCSYLAGLLLGKKIKNLNKKIIVDSGLIRSTKGSRVYSAVKGVIDSGIKIKCDEKMFPSKDRIEGKNINIDKKIFDEIVKKIKENG